MLTPVDQIPKHVRDAFVAAEDARFYTHGGIDYLGIARAAWANLRAGHVVQGGSTITQQVAKLLIVGPDINLSGEITACDRLVVEGSVQVTLNRTRAIEIAETGRFTNGKAEVDEAEIAGTIYGTLTARGSLMVRGTGRVLGTARCRRLQVEDGGHITGRMEMIAADGHPPAPRAPSHPAEAMG